MRRSPVYSSPEEKSVSPDKMSPGMLVHNHSSRSGRSPFLFSFRLGRSSWFAGRIALRVSFFSGRFCLRFRLGRCGLRAGLVIPSGGSSRRTQIAKNDPIFHLSDRRHKIMRLRRLRLLRLLLTRMFAGRLAVRFFQESCHSFVLFAIDKCIEVSGYPLGLRGHRRQAEYTHCYYCFFHFFFFSILFN